jgi:hypothetical protein
VFDLRWTCDGKNSSEFKRAVVVMHGSSPWILGEKEGLSGDLNGHSSGAGRAMNTVGWRGVEAMMT